MSTHGFCASVTVAIARAARIVAKLNCMLIVQSSVDLEPNRLDSGDGGDGGVIGRQKWENRAI